MTAVRPFPEGSIRSMLSVPALHYGAHRNPFTLNSYLAAHVVGWLKCADFRAAAQLTR